MLHSRKKNDPSKAKDALTILIPSKGRPTQLAALLSYFNAMKVQYPVTILLSGKRKTYLPDNYPNLRLTCIEFAEEVALQTKLRYGVKRLETPLVAMCADDDIVLPGALTKACDFLMEYGGYSAAQGYHALFTEDVGITNLHSIAYFTPSLDSHDPLLRLNQLIRRYQPVCWAVFRTETMKDIIYNFSDDRNFLFNELLWSGIAALRGKVKRLPQLYCLRRIDKMHLMGHPICLR